MEDVGEEEGKDEGVKGEEERGGNEEREKLVVVHAGFTPHAVAPEHFAVVGRVDDAGVAGLA